MAQSTTPGGEPLLTRYLIFEADESGVELTRIGEQLARGSDQALRQFFAEPLIDRDGHYVAISENACKLRRVEAKVRTSIGDVALGPVPIRPTPEPDPEPEVERETLV